MLCFLVFRIPDDGQSPETQWFWASIPSYNLWQKQVHFPKHSACYIYPRQWTLPVIIFVYRSKPVDIVLDSMFLDLTPFIAVHSGFGHVHWDEDCKTSVGYNRAVQSAPLLFAMVCKNTLSHLHVLCGSRHIISDPTDITVSWTTQWYRSNTCLPQTLALMPRWLYHPLRGPPVHIR
jgi:hypothetical protein